MCGGCLAVLLVSFIFSHHLIHHPATLERIAESGSKLTFSGRFKLNTSLSTRSLSKSTYSAPHSRSRSSPSLVRL